MCDTLSRYLRLTTEGVLCDVLLDSLWCDCLHIKKEVIELMMFYGLMTPILEDCSVTFSEYIVPSLLPKLVTSEVIDGVKSHCYFLLATKSLTSKWEKVGNVASAAVAAHGFCPTGLFSRLIGKIVSKCQSVYVNPLARFFFVTFHPDTISSELSTAPQKYTLALDRTCLSCVNCRVSTSFNCW